jgi:hypothetical protein
MVKRSTDLPHHHAGRISAVGAIIASYGQPEHAAV